VKFVRICEDGEVGYDAQMTSGMQEAAHIPTHSDETSGNEEEHMGVATLVVPPLIHSLCQCSLDTRFSHREVTTARSAEMFEVLEPDERI